MHRAWLFPVLVSVSVGALIVSTRPSARDASAVAVPQMPVRSAVGVRRSDETLRGLQPYIDPDFAFSLAIPDGWLAVVAAQSEEKMAMHEPGYAVGFRPSHEHAGDGFVDYLMIEILPGRDSGLFETDGSRRREAIVDGRRGWREELALPASSFGATHETPSNEQALAEESRIGFAPPLDLLVRQAAISGLGYTIGFYAIGDPSRRSLLDAAFETMLRTFHLPNAPFDVS